MKPFELAWNLLKMDYSKVPRSLREEEEQICPWCEKPFTGIRRWPGLCPECKEEFMEQIRNAPDDDYDEDYDDDGEF